MPIVIFAGDHGIAAQGVSAYPQEVTIAMMANFAAGGAAISVLARELGSQLEVVDAGTLADLPLPGVVTDKPRRGTRDFSKEAALDATDVAFALDCGGRAVVRASAQKPDLLIFGEMGIGNTTTSATMAAALLGIGPDLMAGSGTGLDTAGRTRKAQIIAAALAHHGLATEASPERDPVRGRRAGNCGDHRRDHRRRPKPHSNSGRRLHRVGRRADRRPSQSILQAISVVLARLGGAGAPAGS